MTVSSHPRPALSTSKHELGRFFTLRPVSLLHERVTSAGPVDGKRRKERKELFAGSATGLAFVTAFTSRDTMRSFLSHISWETEVWTAEAPDHLIHFNRERFLGPYLDVLPGPKMGPQFSVSTIN